MQKFEIRMKPQGAVLDEYMRSRARVTMIMGPLGSGKTFQSCQRLLTAMAEQRQNAEGIRKTRFYAVRNTYPDLKTTTIKDWIDLFGDLGRYKGGGDEPPTHFLDFDLEDGSRVVSELVFLALDTVAHVKKLRGAQTTGFWLNEVKELPKAIIDMCDLRHGRYPSKMDGGPTWHGMIGDTNAPDDDHWYHDQAEEVQPDGWVFLKQPGGVIRDGLNSDGGVIWRVNPYAENLNNLPAGYYQNGMAGKKDSWVSVNLANEYGAVYDGKPVYPDYNERIHYSDRVLTPYKGLPLVLGWDFGLTPAVIFMQLTPRGQLRILDELVSENMGIERFSRDIVNPHIANNYPEFKDKINSFGDPGGGQRAQTDERTCIQVLNGQGIPTVEASTQNPEARKGAVDHFLTKLVDGKPGLLVSHNCKTINKALKGGYKYDRVQVSGDERFHDKPNKNKYSHPAEALEYGVMSIDGRFSRVDLYDKTPARSHANHGPADAGGY